MQTLWGTWLPITHQIYNHLIIVIDESPCGPLFYITLPITLTLFSRSLRTLMNVEVRFTRSTFWVLGWSFFSDKLIRKIIGMFQDVLKDSVHCIITSSSQRPSTLWNISDFDLIFKVTRFQIPAQRWRLLGPIFVTGTTKFFLINDPDLM